MAVIMICVKYIFMRLLTAINIITSSNESAFDWLLCFYNCKSNVWLTNAYLFVCFQSSILLNIDFYLLKSIFCVRLNCIHLESNCDINKTATTDRCGSLQDFEVINLGSFSKYLLTGVNGMTVHLWLFQLKMEKLANY